MKSKLIGGILLVIGTTIGAGILALPTATAELGFFGSILLLVGAWAIMTICAFVFLEVNLWLPPNTNLISMAGATLGKPGQTVTWILNLVLLYSILCAYIDGGGDLFHYLLASVGIHLSISAASALFTLVFGLIVYFGIKLVDYVNRGLMFGKMGAYLLLVLLILPFVTHANLGTGEFHHFLQPRGLTTVAVAFGSLMIIPSLRTYFDDDVKLLRKAIFIGMLIPLLCYIAWDMVILGVVPLNGTLGLKAISQSSTSNSDLLVALTGLLQKGTVISVAKFFTSICMTTSFLAISLSLSDFLADGLSVAKRGMSALLVSVLTFGPPLLVVLFYPNGFQRGLEYAGLCVFVLMILLPALMAWVGRYQLNLPRKRFHVPGGKWVLGLLVAYAVIMIGLCLQKIYPGVSLKLLVVPPMIFVTLMIGLNQHRGRKKSLDAQMS